MSNDQPSSVSRYLLDRIAAAGVRHVFGLPGDYNLTFLDEIEAHPGLRWVGNANELNAAYMADGYARVNGLGVVVTTYGVGELSAMNGIAGAYAENVPVLHIAGTPSLDIQRRRLPVHHSLLDGDHGHFLRAAREVTCAAASLDEVNAAGEIDRVIGEILRRQKPGYLALPSDLVTGPCPPPPAAAVARTPADGQAPARAFADSAARLLDGSTTVTVLVDALAGRRGVAPALNELIRKARLTAAVTTGGKGVLDESAGTFAGLYIGELSTPATRSLVEDADVVIRFGAVENDLSTGGFTTRIDPARCIDIHPDHASIGAVRIANLTMQQAIDELSGLLDAPAGDPRAPPVPAPPASGDPGAPISQDVLWQRIGGFLRPGDILAADQGTPFYGLLGQRLPAGVEVVAQPGWSSIGYALPAVAGAAARRRAAQASRPRHRRRRRAADDPGNRHPGAGRPQPGHRLGQQRRLHSRTRDQRPERRLQRHHALELAGNPRCLRCQRGRRPGPHRGRAGGGTGEAVRRRRPDPPPGGVPRPARPAAAAEADRRGRRPAQRTVDQGPLALDGQRKD